MYSELSLLVELQNPLYLFPIFGVVFTALVVYAFGFKSSTQPPTEVFDALNDKQHKNYKTHESIKKKKQNQKLTPKPEAKAEPNGHITTGSAKPSEKKAPKKAAVELKPDPKPGPENKSKSNTKRTQKNKKSEDLEDKQFVDDKDSGEWVQLISKKEKKNRKQKEEQLLIESKTKFQKSSDKSPKKNKNQKNIALDSNTDLKPKPTEETVVEKENDLNSAKTQNRIQNEELVTEENDIYELAKEQRVPKKTQKHNQKRNSESEVTAKVELPLESEPKPNAKDKLTAAIVANYEANDKTDSSNTSNNKKKKEKNKKKQTQTGNQTNNGTNDKQVIKNEEKIVLIETNGTPIEKSNNSGDVDIPNDIKVSEEEEFKSVGKKRRARRE